MCDTCGPTSGTQFAAYDPDGRSWRTWPGTGLWGSIEFSGTWPRTGCMRDGSAFEHPTSAHHTYASGSSSLLPTPIASDAVGGPQPPESRRAGKTVDAWDEWTARMRAKHSNGNGHGKSLEIEAKRLLPTPRHTDHHDSLTAPAARKHVEDGNGTLPETIGYNLLPTPRASDAAKGGPNQRGSRGDLMPASAVHRTGAATSPQFADGNTSSDDTLPGL